MKFISFDEELQNFKNAKSTKNDKSIRKYVLVKFIILILFLNIAFIYFNLIIIFSIIYTKFINFLYNKEIKTNILKFLQKTNIDTNDEFFQIREVQEQIYNKNLIYVSTISGGKGFIGNALMMLNKLINICENIKCKNIITPEGLDSLIKNPVFYKDYNITILPNSYKNKIKVDIQLSNYNNFYFKYKKKANEMRLRIIRNEVLNNIPEYKAQPHDLYINIRSGDIFVNVINPNYAQPPLCFYQKIISQNKYKQLYILSNGHENPVVDELIKIYPKIKYLHGSVIEDISVVIYAYNFVMPESSFPKTLIYLNNNLKNLYFYEIIHHFIKNVNCTVYRMEPSPKYLKEMKGKWKNTKEQLNLMLNDKCIHSNMTASLFY